MWRSCLCWQQLLLASRSAWEASCRLQVQSLARFHLRSLARLQRCALLEEILLRWSIDCFLALSFVLLKHGLHRFRHRILRSLLHERHASVQPIALEHHVQLAATERRRMSYSGKPCKATQASAPQRRHSRPFALLQRFLKGFFGLQHLLLEQSRRRLSRRRPSRLCVTTQPCWTRGVVCCGSAAAGLFPFSRNWHRSLPCD